MRSATSAFVVCAFLLSAAIFPGEARAQANAAVPPALRIAIENMSCQEADGLLAKLNAEAAAKKQGPVMPPDATKGCAAALEIFKAAGLTLKQYATAYEAWYGFQTRAGLLPALDPAALGKRAVAFEAEINQTIKEAAAPGPMPLDKLAKRQILGQMPVAFWLSSELRSRLPAERDRALADAGNAETWAKFEPAADRLLWLAAFLREPGADAPKAHVMGLVTSAKKGGFSDKAAEWDALGKSPSQAIQIVAKRARSLAAGDLASKADAKVKAKDWAAAAGFLAQAMKLSPDDPKLAARRQVLGQRLADERAALLGALKNAKNPKEGLAAWKKVAAFDAATEGPSAFMDKGERDKIQVSLEWYAAGKQAETAAGVGALNPSGVDCALEAVAHLRQWTKTWAMQRALALRRQKDLAGAEHALATAAPLFPGDKEIAGLLEAIRNEALAGKFERFEELFRAGNVAAGYVAFRTAPGLSDPERAALAAKHDAEIRTMKASLGLRGKVSAAAGFAAKVATAAAGSGPGWKLAPDSDAGAGEAYAIAVKVKLAAPPDFSPKHQRTEKAMAKLQGPPQQMPNPDRQKCDAAYVDRQTKIQAMEQAAKTPPQPVRCAPAAEGWTGFGGENVATPTQCPQPPPPPSSQQIAAEQQALGAFGAQCAAIPPYVTGAAEQPYNVEYWAAVPAASIEIEFDDLAHGDASLGRESFSDSLKLEDRVIRPQPQLGVVGDPLQLPPVEKMEADLAAALAPKLRAAFEKRTKEYWKTIEAEARTAAGPQRCELFARLLVIEELTGAKIPGHADWRTEANACAAAPAK
ncbi:MAG: hypothetical protein HY897_24980 [Deltaproteobacteria bacterium]|nr:hypothetical protein [Deltaproteobacteria bacterium]